MNSYSTSLFFALFQGVEFEINKRAQDCWRKRRNSFFCVCKKCFKASSKAGFTVRLYADSATQRRIIMEIVQNNDKCNEMLIAKQICHGPYHEYRLEINEAISISLNHFTSFLVLLYHYPIDYFLLFIARKLEYIWKIIREPERSWKLGITMR